jgi:hemerythrin-like domain-containing protein
MTVLIGARRPAAEPDAIDRLLECHERIRRFISAAAKLAAFDSPDPREVAAGAGEIHRYFALAFRLHAEDEDELIVPAVLDADGFEQAQAVAERLPLEHQEMDGVLASLLPIWARIAASPAALEGQRVGVAAQTRLLQTLIEQHLDAEERILFPAARQILSAEQQREACRRMVARRTEHSFSP